MPHPEDKVKGSGDVHQPDLDDKALGSNEAQEDEARPGKGENQAGFLKDKEAPGPGEGSRSR